jgi:hypothetical protein
MSNIPCNPFDEAKKLIPMDGEPPMHFWWFVTRRGLCDKRSPPPPEDNGDIDIMVVAKERK